MAVKCHVVSYRNDGIQREGQECSIHLGRLEGFKWRYICQVLFCSSWSVYVARYCLTESLRAMNVTSRCELSCGGAGSLARKVRFSLRRAMSGNFGTSAIIMVRLLEQRGAL